MGQQEFIPGLELNRRFYFEAVRPILNKHFPSLSHTAAYIGTGSDVLGFDTLISITIVFLIFLKLFALLAN